MSTTTNLAYNWNFARDFPDLGADLVERPHFLETIVEILTAETPVVFLEGEAGDGATTTLTQFCKRYPTVSFSLFIRPASRFAYSPDYLRLALAEQIHWYIYGKALNRETLDANEFSTLIFRMRAKQRSCILFFVVDGLHQIPAEDQRFVADIFSHVLPLGVDNCRFVITGQQQNMQPMLRGGLKSKPYHQLRFSQDEARQFLASTGLDENDCSRVYKVCRQGIPGRLAAVKRLLLAGTTLQAILEVDPTKYLEFLKLEFAALDRMTEAERLLVGTIAYSKMSMTCEQTAEMTDTSKSEVDQIVAQCQFLAINPGSKYIEFISLSHQKCAEKQLELYRKRALTLQVEHLRKNPRSNVALRFLPTYYETLNRQEAIVSLLSKEHYSDLLQSTQSFTALRNRAELGARAAKSLNQTGEVFKFALQKSIFASASSFDGSEAQIEALIALGKPGEALTLANGAAAKEDRLALLAAYARGVKERKSDVDVALLKVIKDLIGQIDFSELGDEAIKIAANVLIFDPDAAIGMIESAVKGASQSARDTAFAELSMSGTVSKLTHRTQFEDKARPQISDAALQLVARSFAALAESLDIGEIKKDLALMPIENRVYFLRSFIGLRKDDARILDLVDYGLDTMISEAAYTPRINDLAEMALPLTTQIDDHSRLRRLVARFESQMGLAAKAAQSKDLTRLQLRLAAAERQYDESLCRDRIEQTIFDAMEIRVPEVQIECYGLLLRALRRLDSEGRLENRDGFKAIVNTELAAALQSLLKDTGEQLMAVSAALGVLAADDAENARNLAKSLNTESRRNKAFALIAAVIATKPFAERQIVQLRASLADITDNFERADATLALLDQLDVNSDRNAWLVHLEAFRDNLIEPRDFGRWDVWMFKSGLLLGEPQRTLTFVSRVEASIARMESILDKVDLCFRTSEALAAVDPIRANQHYDQGVRFKQSIAFNSAGLSKLLELCLALVARSMTTLARCSMLDSDKLDRYDNLVAELPSVLARVRAYCDLTERLWCASKADLAIKIVRGPLQALLTEAEGLDSSTKESAVVTAFPSLCFWHPATALQKLAGISVRGISSALYEATMLRLRKLPAATADLGGKIDHSRLEAHEVTDVIEFMKRAPTDVLLYGLMHALIDVIANKQNKTRFTSQQKADWATQCRTIINDKLPDTRNIKHDGFKAACLALTYRLEDTVFAKWEQLVDMAESIESVADRSYVYLLLASCVPTKHQVLRETCLKSALEFANKIPSQLDRLSHLQDYAQEAFANDASASARETLRHAMRLSLEIENNSRAVRHRRELIDLADQIDPKFADELIEQIDDDPARAILKADAKRAGSLAKAKRELANARRVGEVSECDVEILPEAAWRNLAALESGRLESKPLDVMTAYVAQAAGSTLTDAFPTLSWHLANMERKYRSPQDVTNHVEPVCEALLLSTEIAQAVVCQTAKRKAQPEEEVNGGMLVTRNGREEALNYIEDWVRANAVDYVKYCDPYFSTKDIALIRLVLAQAPTCKLFVIASKAHLQNENELSDDAFKRAWRSVSEQDPPETEVIAIH